MRSCNNSTTRRHLVIWELLKHLATCEKDSIGSSAGKMYKSGAKIVTSVLRNKVLRKIVAPLKTVNVGTPMEWIAIDVLGPLPMTEAGSKYIIIIADYFTKWVEVFPLPNQEAITVADKLVNEVICRFVVPLMIHSDQGQIFESALFAEVSAA